MDLDVIKDLLKTFDESGLSKMELDIEGLSIKLEKEATVQETVYTVPAGNAPVEQSVQASNYKEEEKEEAKPSGTEVKAPLVGIFYRAASPESKPFVKEGQQVKKGDTVCIVEAMKVMNEITAPCDGVLTVVLPQDGDMVEFDQTLMIIS